MGKVKQQQQDLLDAAEPGPEDFTAYIASNPQKQAINQLNDKGGSMRSFFGLLFLFALGLAALVLTGCDSTAKQLDCLDGCDSKHIVHESVVEVEVPVACEVPESLPDSCRIVSENKNKYVIHCDKAAE